MTQTYNSTALKELAPGAASRVIERIKADPMAILPINMFCAVLDIKDPLTVIKNFEPDKEDVGIMVNACIGCIPVVGPLLQGFFSLFWKRASESNTVTKEELKKELDKLRKEMMEAVAGKIKDSEAKQWTEICEAFLSGLKKSFKVLTIHINALKHEFAEKQDADEQVQEAVRIDLELIRDKSMSLHEFCSSKDYLEFTLPYYVQSLQIYTVVMTIMDSFWYQIGIKPMFVSGKAATATIDAVPSFRERMHEEIIPALANIVKGIDAQKKAGLDLSTVPFLLKSDKYLYPIPLIEAPVKIPNVVKKMDQISSATTPEITLPDRATPYIYRIDCINFRPDASSEDIRGYRTMAAENEPITGCKGNQNGLSAQLIVHVPKGKTVQVRVMGQYSIETKDLPLSIEEYRPISYGTQSGSLVSVNLGLGGPSPAPQGPPQPQGIHLVMYSSNPNYGQPKEPLPEYLMPVYPGAVLPAVQEPIAITKFKSDLETKYPNLYKVGECHSGLTYSKPMVDIKKIGFRTHSFQEGSTISRILFVELIVQNNASA